jgi:O-antigen/teichoic acid export membrane protein
LSDAERPHERAHGTAVNPSPAGAANSDISVLARGAGVGLVGKALGRGLHILSQVILARMLGPASFGLYALGWTLLRMIGVLAPAGLDKGVLRYGSEYWGERASDLKGVVIVGGVLATAVGGVIGGSLFIGAPLISEQIFGKPDLAPVLRWFAPGFAIVAGLKVVSATTRITRRMQYGALTEDILQPAVNVVLVVLFLAMGWELIGAVAATVISLAASCGLGTWYVFRLFPEFRGTHANTGHWRELVRFSLPTAFAGVFAAYLLWIDRVYVGMLAPARDLGIYQAASQTAVVFTLVLAPFNAIFAPMIPKLYHSKDLARLGEIFTVSTKWVIYLSMPIFLVIYFFPKEIMTGVFGAEYVSGAGPLVILAAGQVLALAGGVVGILLIMTGNQRIWMVLSGSSLLLHAAFSLILIPSYGLVGAASATASSLVVISVGGLLVVRSRLGLTPYDSRYLKGVAAASGSSLALYVLRAVSPLGALPNILAALSVSALTFWFVLALLKVDAEERQLIASVRQRLGREARA